MKKDFLLFALSIPKPVASLIRMEFQAGGTSWCYDNFELELENGARYKCSSLEYTADLWNPATGNACSAVVIA